MVGDGGGDRLVVPSVVKEQVLDVDSGLFGPSFPVSAAPLGALLTSPHPLFQMYYNL